MMPARAITCQAVPFLAALAGVAPVSLVVDGHRIFLLAPTARAKTSSSVGTLGRRCRTCTTLRGREPKNGAGRQPSPGTNTRITSSSVSWHS